MLVFVQRKQPRLSVLQRYILKNFFKKINLKVGKFAVLKLVLNWYSYHLAVVNRTVNRLQLLHALSPDYLASQLKYQCTPCHCVCVCRCVIVFTRFQFVQKCQVRDFLLRDSALEVDLELVHRFGLELNGLLFLMMKISTAFKFDPIMYGLTGSIFNLNKLGTLLTQVTGEVNGFRLGQLLWQQFIQLVNEQKHLFLLD